MAEDADDKKERKTRARPSMQIYRPPGTRVSQDDAKDTPAPIAAAGTKPPHTKRSNPNGKQASPTQSSQHSGMLAGGAHAGAAHAATPDASKKAPKHKTDAGKTADARRPAPKGHPARTYQRSKTGHKFDGKGVKDDGDGRRSASPTMEQRRAADAHAKRASPAVRAHALPMTPRPTPLSAVHAPAHKHVSSVLPLGTKTSSSARTGGKVVAEAEWADLCQVMLQLDSKDRHPLDEFIASRCTDESVAASAARTLVEHVVEGAFPPLASFPKTAARASAQLVDVGTAACADAFHAALVERLRQYTLSATSLRHEHPRWWYTLLNYLSDVLASLGGTYDGELVNVVLYAYACMLKPPMLAHLNIKELELLIASLLHIGQDLERQCPEQVAALRDCIRDAFVTVTEPWQRKMVLLLVELAACGWRLPDQANDYYFQAATHEDTNNNHNKDGGQ